MVVDYKKKYLKYKLKYLKAKKMHGGMTFEELSKDFKKKISNHKTWEDTDWENFWVNFSIYSIIHDPDLIENFVTDLISSDITRENNSYNEVTGFTSIDLNIIKFVNKILEMPKELAIRNFYSIVPTIQEKAPYEMFQTIMEVKKKL